MFTEPRHRRRAMTLAAILLVALIAIPVALRRPEASGQSLSTVRASADALEAHNRPQPDVDPWIGLEDALAIQKWQQAEWYAAAHAEEHRQAAIAAAAERKRQETAAAQAAAKPRQAAAPAAKDSAPAVSDGSVWDRLAACESHGNWSINTGNGYYGGLQMDTLFWDTYGNPAYGQASEASRSEQIAAATKARDSGRGYYPWPTCARKLGLI